MKELPIACTLGPDAIKAQRDDLLMGLMQQADQRLDLPNGYCVRFASGQNVLAEIAKVIDTERQCCRFLTFQLTIEPDGGPIWLEFTGPPGTREFLAGVLDL